MNSALPTFVLVCQLAWITPVRAQPRPELQPEPQADASLATGPEPALAPFAWGDFTWMNGQSKQKTFVLPALEALAFSLYLDTYYALSNHLPLDDTLSGTASVGRSNELQINLATIGLEFKHAQVIGKLNLQFGNTLSIVQDQDGSAARGRDLSVANLKYIREATLGYQFEGLHGVNLEAGIFMSYIGLESYLMAENWNYVRSLICDHTPFYFQGVRAQIFVTDRLKIEPWVMNGWQTYGRWNNLPSVGMAWRYNPRESVALIANFYLGEDTPNAPARLRFHHDHSILVRYLQRPGAAGISRMAFSFNNHAGFETGGPGRPGLRRAHVLGTSLANRIWFYRDLLSTTLRLEYMTNPSRYLAQFPPPDLADRPGTDLQLMGLTLTASLMPRDFFELRAEAVYRRASVPYFTGSGGGTSPTGFQQAPPPAGYSPDSAKTQTLFVLSANFRL